ncbi:MAG: hypothetical protein NC820_05935 [Candidatus Omnitrophica bacterium]|nr:hypothetical protein [Candidatus Omnitrophota bacterium]
MLAYPNIFILPLFGNQFWIKEIPSNRFIDRILNLNQLTAELGNYNEYYSLFSLLRLDTNIFSKRKETLEMLLKGAICYEICMCKSDGIYNNISKLKELVIK